MENYAHWNTISKLKQVLICKIKYLATYFDFTSVFLFPYLLTGNGKRLPVLPSAGPRRTPRRR